MKSNEKYQLKPYTETQDNLLWAPVLKDMLNNYLEGMYWKAYTQDMKKWTRLLKPLMEKFNGGVSVMLISASTLLSTHRGLFALLPQIWHNNKLCHQPLTGIQSHSSY